MLGHVGRRIAAQRQAFRACDAREDLRHLVDDVVQPRRFAANLELTGLDLRKIEDVVDEAQQRARRTAQQPDGLALFFVEPRVAQKLEEPEYRVHRRPDLVADCREERALRAARGLGRLLRLVQIREDRLVERLLAREVQRALGHALFELLVRDP